MNGMGAVKAGGRPPRFFNKVAAAAAAHFHSTPFLERGRRSNSNSPSSGSNHSRRSRNLKQSLMRNISGYAEQLFQSWSYDPDSWFKRDNQVTGHTSGCLSSDPRNKGRRLIRIREEDVETIFKSVYGEKHYQFFYQPFTKEESKRSSSEGYCDKRTTGVSDAKAAGYTDTKKSSNYKKTPLNSKNKEQKSSTKSANLELESSDLTSYRQALGLCISGPLCAEDVKNAYRACALKWHPDRHQGSSKAVAEEKFKICSSAYESLCEKLGFDQ